MDRENKKKKEKNINFWEFILNVLSDALTEIGRILLLPFREILSPIVSFWKGSKIVASNVNGKINGGKKTKEAKVKKKRGRPKKIPESKKLEIKLDYITPYIKRIFNTIVNYKINIPKMVLRREKVTKEKETKKTTTKPIKEYKKDIPSRIIVKRSFSIGVFILGTLFALTFIMIPYEMFTWFRSLPKAELLIIEGSRKPTKILDKDGNLLYEIFVDRKYDPVELEQIPQIVVDATLAVEDSEFYNHNGVRLESMLRAARMTLFEGEKQGGSTITQQLIKNVLLTPERTISRKLKEIVLAVMVESRYSKDQILELYFNNIAYGGTAWGIQTASQKYFGKNVWELDLAEASMLAGLPSAPSTYSPLTDLTLAKQRQKYVLSRMYDLDLITKGELVYAYGEELNLIDQGEFMKAPHFVHFVRQELERMYGKRFVEYGGLTVTTTLDLNLQSEVERIVKEEIEKDRYLNLTNGAAVVLDTKNAGILSHVGSFNYYQEGWGAYDVATAYRQPGSSIKPVTYALALSSGFTPATIIKDSPITYQIAGSRPYSPVNYDGKYHGNVPLRYALANSYNIPAVRVANAVGPDNIVELGKSMGLSNWDVDGTYGLAITLGGKEVRLLDLTNVYATFGRGGRYKKITPFLSIIDSNGYEIYEKDRENASVVSEEVSYLIWHILSDNVARTPAFGPNSSLVIPKYKVAVKTGTTDNKRDNWTMGFTPSFAIGVWVGNNDNTPMNQYLASGLTGASPIWNRITTEVLKNQPNEIVKIPSGVFMKSDKECNRSEVFIKGTNIPKTLCPPKEKKEEDKDDEDEEKDRD